MEIKRNWQLNFGFCSVAVLGFKIYILLFLKMFKVLVRALDGLNIKVQSQLL